MAKAIRKSYYLRMSREEDRKIYDEVINSPGFIIGYQQQFTPEGEMIVFFVHEAEQETPDEDEE